MKRLRRPRILTLIIVATLSILAFFLLYDFGPKHQGKGVIYWLSNYGPETIGGRTVRTTNVSVIPFVDKQGRRVPQYKVTTRNIGGRRVYPGRNALEKIGPPAAPYLVKAIQYEDSFITKRYRAWHPGLDKWTAGLAPSPPKSVSEIRKNAATALNALKFNEAIPGLLSLLTQASPDVREEVMRALRGYDGTKEPLKTAMQEFYETGISNFIALDIARTVRIDESLRTRILSDLLDSDDYPMTSGALEVLNHRCTTSEIAGTIPSLMKFADRSYEDRTLWKVLSLLERCGPEAEPSMPLLKDSLRESHSETRYLTVRVLASMANQSKEARNLLATLAEDPQPMVRNVVARALAGQPRFPDSVQ